MIKFLASIFAPVLILPSSQRHRVICWGDAFAVIRGAHIEADRLSYQAAVELSDRLNRGN